MTMMSCVHMLLRVLLYVSYRLLLEFVQALPTGSNGLVHLARHGRFWIRLGTRSHMQ